MVITHHSDNDLYFTPGQTVIYWPDLVLINYTRITWIIRWFVAAQKQKLIQVCRRSILCRCNEKFLILSVLKNLYLWEVSVVFVKTECFPGWVSFWIHLGGCFVSFGLWDVSCWCCILLVDATFSWLMLGPYCCCCVVLIDVMPFWLMPCPLLVDSVSL